MRAPALAIWMALGLADFLFNMAWLAVFVFVCDVPSPVRKRAHEVGISPALLCACSFALALVLGPLGLALTALRVPEWLRVVRAYLDSPKGGR